MSNLLLQSIKSLAKPHGETRVWPSNYRSLFSLIRLPKPLCFAFFFFNLNVSSQQMTNFILKFLWNKAPTDDVRFLSTEAKPARGSRDHSHLFAGHRAAGRHISWLTLLMQIMHLGEKALQLSPTEKICLRIYIQSLVQRDHQSACF